MFEVAAKKSPGVFTGEVAFTRSELIRLEWPLAESATHPCQVSASFYKVQSAVGS